MTGGEGGGGGGGGAGLIPCRVIPKTLKMVLAVLLLGAQHKKVELGTRTGQLSVSKM